MRKFTKIICVIAIIFHFLLFPLKLVGLDLDYHYGHGEDIRTQEENMKAVVDLYDCMRYELYYELVSSIILVVCVIYVLKSRAKSVESRVESVESVEREDLIQPKTGKNDDA